MPPTIIYQSPNHQNIMLEDLDLGHAVQSNQHVIIHGKEALLLDPGGPKTFRHAYPALLQMLKQSKLTHIFLSHQDPDIVAAINAWLTQTTARAYLSKLWVRFVPHFGLDRIMTESSVPIPDEGGTIEVGGVEMLVIPAHFLHSPGNFQIYDPVSKTLYSGDLGASLGQSYVWVEDFEAHRAYMDGFHARYMSGGRAMRLWAHLARQLDIEVIAPQHGALFRGQDMVQRFIEWADGMPCGVDILPQFPLPTKKLG